MKFWRAHYVQLCVTESTDQQMTARVVYCYQPIRCITAWGAKRTDRSLRESNPMMSGYPHHAMRIHQARTREELPKVNDVLEGILGRTMRSMEGQR